MNRPGRFARVLVVAVMALSSSCHEHDHGPDGSHGDNHGHAHGPAEDEVPTLDVTVYESGLELFMEYPAFIVGRDSPLVAHFTDTRDPEGFKGVGSGRVTAVLAIDGGAEERFVVHQPQRFGVWKPVVRPTRSGAGTLRLILEGPEAQGTVELGPVVVHADAKAAIAAAPEDVVGEKTWPYLKEAMWKTRYATAVASQRVLRGGIAATGEIVPVAGQAAELSAPAAARVVVRDVARDGVPHVGQRVKRGQVLFTLVPLSSSQGDPASVELELAEARAWLGLKERDAARLRELFTAGAVSQQQQDAAIVDVEVARARVDAAMKRQALLGAAGGTASAQGAIELRAPLDGTVAFADVVPGAVVQPGQRLALVVNAERVWLKVGVPELDIARAADSEAATFSVPGFDTTFSVAPPAGRRVAVGAAVDVFSRTVPVIFELPNPDGRLRPGMSASATLFAGDTVEGVAVDEGAILDEGGQPIVYVMDGGESFFRRRVRLGVREGGFVQILDGVQAGERVVTRGAFEITLANANGVPAHGHAH